MLNLSDEQLAQLDPGALTALLRAAPSAESARALWPALEKLPAACPKLAAAFLDALGGEGEEALRIWLEKNTGRGEHPGGESFPGSVPPMALWLTAAGWEQLGDDARTRAAWESVAEADGFGQPGEARLALARLQLRAGEPEMALATLREALRRGGAEYDFWSRADRLLRKLSQKIPTPERPLKIALLGSSTTTFLAAAVRVAAVRDGFFPAIYESPYGAWRQDILDEGSGLYTFTPDVVILATHGRDAGLPTFAAADEADSPPPIFTELKSLWARLLERLSCTVLQHSFDLPAEDAGSMLSANAPAGRVRRLRALNESLRREAPSGVAMVDLEALAAGATEGGWSDPRQWFLHKQHPAMEALPLLADAYLGLIRAAAGTARKVLVLDLDNTLWGGVIGEDGLAGIRVGPPHAEGEAYAALQHYARDLKERGVLLAVCSKNNAADARLPFEKHDGIVLKLDDFAAFVANWESKPANLRALAAELNLGLDSFVFVDDNPVERAQVQRELPEVAVPELGADPAQFVNILARGHWFEALRLSGEDRARHAAYRANSERRELEQAAPDLESFLRQLRMTVAHGPFTPENLDRVAQLIGKTNQFNLTTRRHSVERLQQLAADPATWTQAFRLKDRYGDNGLVGVIIAIPSGEEEWEVDTFLMSCRVIGRGLADYMALTLLKAARTQGIKRVTGIYIPTAKNAMVADFYFRYGFAARLDPADQIRAGAPRHFVFEVSKQELPAIADDLFTVSE